jgi:cobalt-zinc-cadmium efflux system outer membrane protein
MNRRLCPAIVWMAWTCIPLARAPSVLAQEAGESVSLEEALSLFGRNSPGLQLARSRLRGRLGEVRQSRARPNPQLAVTHESLGDYSESYLNLTQPVDFLWESGSRDSRAEALTLQARARFLADSARLALEVKRAYLGAWQAMEIRRTYQQAEGLMAQLLASAEARFSEGDIAGYDLRRLRLEHLQFQRRTAAVELDLEEAEHRLGALLMATDDARRLSALEVGAEEMTAGVPSDPVAQALTRRPDIQAAEAVAEARGKETTLSRASVLRGTSLTGGIKRQSDGMDGLFMGLAIPVPIADRRGGAIDAAQAAALAADSEVTLLRRAIAQEVSIASSRLSTAQRQQEVFGSESAQEAEELLAIARLSFAEGEMRAVDLLDAAKAFVEARLLGLQVRADLWDAYFELEQALGGFSTESDKGVNER